MIKTFCRNCKDFTENILVKEKVFLFFPHYFRVCRICAQPKQRTMPVIGDKQA